MLVNSYFSEVVNHIHLELIKKTGKAHKTIIFYKTPFVAIVERIAFILTVTVTGGINFLISKKLIILN